MALQVTIGGTDRTRKIEAYSLRIDNILTSKRDVCAFSILNNTGNTYKPNLGQEVICYDGSTKIFAGVLTSIDSSAASFGMIRHRIQCQDYTRLLDQKLVPDTFENKTVDQIIATLKASYFPEHFTTTNVSAPVTIKYVAFNYKTVAKCLEELANLINYDWYIDYDKDLHFFAKESVLSPFNLSDTGGKYRYDTLVIRKDNSQIRNSVIVRGGEYLGSQLTANLQTNGVDFYYPLPYKFADFAAHLTGEILSVGIDGIDAADSYDALYNFQEKILKFKSVDTPSNGKTLKVSGKPYLPVIVKYRSTASIRSMTSAETSGTYTSDGIYEYLIVDKSINSKEGARQRAQAEILAYANTLSEGEFVTETSGLKAGQQITVQSTSRNINEDYIINKVTITQFSASLLLYSVSLITTRTFDLIDVLQRLLLESTKKIEINPNEVTDTIYELEDTAAFSDTTPTTSFSPTSYVYRYGPDSHYGYSVYG
jgi:hypothetical protein